MEKTVFYSDPLITDLAKNSICLTGIGRSGTTILGALVHSLKNVEYAFEPPELIPLFHFIESIPVEIWRYLYEFYLFEGIFSGSLSGRTLNFNESDWSCVFRSKTKEEVQKRMSSSLRRQEILNLIDDRCIAYKIPNILNRIKKLNAFYPKTKTICTIRHPDEVVRSTLERGWYRSPLNLAVMRNTDFGPIPAHIDESNAQRWLSLSEIDKCYDSFCQVYLEEYLTDQLCIIDFSTLCNNPYEVCRSLLKQIGKEYGEKTEELLKTIRKPPLKMDNFTGYQSSSRDKAMEIYKIWFDKAILI
jgi:hypothetical protein